MSLFFPLRWHINFSSCASKVVASFRGRKWQGVAAVKAINWKCSTRTTFGRGWTVSRGLFVQLAYWNLLLVLPAAFSFVCQFWAKCLQTQSYSSSHGKWCVENSSNDSSFPATYCIQIQVDLFLGKSVAENWGWTYNRSQTFTLPHSHFITAVLKTVRSTFVWINVITKVEDCVEMPEKLPCSHWEKIANLQLWALW